MNLALANQINSQIANMMTSRRFLEQGKIGEGNHSNREIASALYLITALEYWFGQITGLATDQRWADHFEKRSSALFAAPMDVALLLIPQGVNLNHLAKLEPESEEYKEALGNRLDAWFTNCHDKQFARIDCLEMPSRFLEFLKKLPLRPSSDFWQQVYSRLSLELPVYDPDRMDDGKGKTALSEQMKNFQSRTERIIKGSQLTPNKSASEAASRREPNTRGGCLILYVLLVLFAYCLLASV